MDSETLDGHGFDSVNIHTADFTLTRQDNGTIHTNEGAAGTIVCNLDAAIPGAHVRFCVGAAQAFRLNPQDADKIADPTTGVAGVAGKYFWADAVGEWADLRCFIAGVWSTKVAGTWGNEA